MQNKRLPLLLLTANPLQRSKCFFSFKEKRPKITLIPGWEASCIMQFQYFCCTSWQPAVRCHIHRDCTLNVARTCRYSCAIPYERRHKIFYQGFGSLFLQVTWKEQGLYGERMQDDWATTCTTQRVRRRGYRQPAWEQKRWKFSKGCSLLRKLCVFTNAAQASLAFWLQSHFHLKCGHLLEFTMFLPS